MTDLAFDKKRAPYSYPKGHLRSLSSPNVSSSACLCQMLSPASGSQLVSQRASSFGRRTVRSRLNHLIQLEFPREASGYELLDICGYGSTAKVYRALCKPLKEIVAVKAIDLEAVGQKNLETILREAQLLSQICHPNVLPMLACFVQEATLYIVTPYFASGSVRSMLDKGSCQGLHERVAIRIMLDVLHALEHLHKYSIVHRDVKASNILLQDEVIVLGDFGVAVKVDRVLEGQHRPDFGKLKLRGSYVGTPLWTAPEIEESGCGHGTQSDIYAFGITIWEMLIGKPLYAERPFKESMTRKIECDAPDLPCSHDGKHISQDLRKIVAMCLQRKPENRPTAEQLLKHRIFKGIEQHGYEDMLSGIVSPFQEAMYDVPDLKTATTKQSLLERQMSRAAAGQWGVKDALSVLHNMLSSDGMPEPLNSTLRLRSISVKAQSSGPNLDRSASTQQKSISSMSSNCTASFRPSSDSVLRQTNSRRLSFSTPKAFAKGQQWPRLPHAALNHCKGILFSCGWRKGVGMSTSWGCGFVMTNLGTASSPCWTAPVNISLAETRFAGVGENFVEMITLLRDNKFMDNLSSISNFKFSDFKLADAVSLNLTEEEVVAILEDGNSVYNGVCLKHYANSKLWSLKPSLVSVDSIRNDELFKKAVDPGKTLSGLEAPPISFRGLISVLIDAQQGHYEPPCCDDN